MHDLVSEVREAKRLDRLVFTLQHLLLLLPILACLPAVCVVTGVIRLLLATTTSHLPTLPVSVLN